VLVAPVVRLHHVVTGMSVRRSCVGSASCQVTSPGHWHVSQAVLCGKRQLSGYITWSLACQSGGVVSVAPVARPLCRRAMCWRRYFTVLYDAPHVSHRWLQQALWAKRTWRCMSPVIHQSSIITLNDKVEFKAMFI